MNAALNLTLAFRQSRTVAGLFITFGETTQYLLWDPVKLGPWLVRGIDASTEIFDPGVNVCGMFAP